MQSESREFYLKRASCHQVQEASVHLSLRVSYKRGNSPCICFLGDFDWAVHSRAGSSCSSCPTEGAWSPPKRALFSLHSGRGWARHHGWRIKPAFNVVFLQSVKCYCAVTGTPTCTVAWTARPSQQYAFGDGPHKKEEIEKGTRAPPTTPIELLTHKRHVWSSAHSVMVSSVPPSTALSAHTVALNGSVWAVQRRNAVGRPGACWSWQIRGDFYYLLASETLFPPLSEVISHPPPSHLLIRKSCAETSRCRNRVCECVYKHIFKVYEFANI